MPGNTLEQVCQQCGATAIGDKFCSNCGQSLSTRRLTVSSIFHEVFHFFTHLDKGFPYTLKKLAGTPGTMQKDYINGHRSRYQKPFSMVFVCGTITAFALYLIHKPTGNITHLDEVKGDFTRHYFVLVQCALLPLYAFVTWMLFGNNKINYAEGLVLVAYTLSCMLLIVGILNFADLIPGKSIYSGFYEIPVLLAYLLWTNNNFFIAEPKWRLLLKSVVNILINYFLSNVVGNLIVNWLL